MALISDEYLAMQKELHLREDYGTASIGYAATVARIINANRITELLDYGAGKGNLFKAIQQGQMVKHLFDYIPYEPAKAEWASKPDPCDMVVCIDVLEHIEPDCLDEVLDDLRRVTSAVGLFTVATGPARKVLADGRNAHLIQRGPEFWLPKIMGRFDLRTFQVTEGGFMVTVFAKDFD